ncbi:calcium-dependent protein kinase 1-like isoform X2 [Magnolia sinica]|uniref:calcium-dependent protein kinase 1-like isoform X2 n=1 Tax=Magnolia sinica TaxID=86752 RepID=UPI00265884ED|nr:calcium-dependent protein kinase 1-like isoform X2 [Magnolia sinica]
MTLDSCGNQFSQFPTQVEEKVKDGSLWIIGAKSEQGIFEQVLNRDLDFSSDPWPSISESAKDLAWRMLIRDPKKRLTAHQAIHGFRLMV